MSIPTFKKEIKSAIDKFNRENDCVVMGLEVTPKEIAIKDSGEKSAVYEIIIKIE